MKKSVSILLTVAFLFLSGCGAKGNLPDVSTSRNGDSTSSEAGSGTTPSVDSSSNSSDASRDPHEPVISSEFDVNGIHFKHHNGAEMECLFFQPQDLTGEELAEITLDGAMLHVQVADKESVPGEYQSIVQGGEKVSSTSGDLAYMLVADSIWTVATDSGKVLMLYGEPDSGDDWKSIAKMLEWSVIDESGNSITEGGYTVQNGLLVPGSKGENMETAGQPATENNTTLSDVVLSDIYESQADMMAEMGDDEHVFADEVCYNLGMGLWDYGDGTENGYIPFWAFFLPPDGTITFSTEGNDRFEENPYFQIDGFTMKEAENSDGELPLKSEELKYWKATFSGRYTSEELSAGEHTISLDEIREEIPEFDVLACWWGDTYILAVCVQ